ncbi:diacylglycerol kinase family protein [Candidatus Woesebacteria bacterium]|jgi:diacylglycerol kinase|nr:diacylglycerol kinase family protein [Candidatus Woesebacteria bacterium]
MKRIIERHTISLKHAVDGVLWSWRTQPNYRVHFIVSALVVIAALYYDIQPFEWIFLVLTISVGLVIETINTALEATSDAITREWREEIKIAKDASAAAMLTYAIGAAIVAAIIFVPKVLL